MMIISMYLMVIVILLMFGAAFSIGIKDLYETIKNHKSVYDLLAEQYEDEDETV